MKSCKERTKHTVNRTGEQETSRAENRVRSEALGSERLSGLATSPGKGEISMKGASSQKRTDGHDRRPRNLPPAEKLREKAIGDKRQRNHALGNEKSSILAHMPKMCRMR